MPRKLKKALFGDRWNWGLTRYEKYNKRQVAAISHPDSIAYRIAMWYCFKTQEHKGYVAEKEIEQHRLFKI